MSNHIVILAAGQGSRMKSSLPKVCHPVAGESMIRHVVRTAQQLSDRITVVVGHGAEHVEQELANEAVQFVTQAEQLGTGHAVAQALPNIADNERVLVLYGDVPLIRAKTLAQLLDHSRRHELTLLTAELDDPSGYGRIIRADQPQKTDQRPSIVDIVEQKDANAEQLAIQEVNTGFVAMPAAALKTWLPRLRNDNAQGEYYLTDLVALAVADGVPVDAVSADHVMETQGVNNRVQLALVERWHQAQKAETLMLSGTTVIDPARLDLRGKVHAGHDCLIDVNVVLENVTLGNNVIIGPNCILRDAHIGHGTEVLANSLIESATVGIDCAVGPYARLRPDAILYDGAKVGNFVEIKKATIEAGAKVNHLTYIGDARVGAGANIGAGTITCNYDGANKHHTDIGAGAFVGSNSTLIAPVTIEKGAFIGAGSVISKTAPAEQLTLSRGKQLTLPNWKRPEKKAK